MATITFGLSDLKKRGVEADLESLVTKLGMDIEKTEGDDVTIDITPNRPDLLDIMGFARAAGFFSGKTKPKENFYNLTREPFTEVTVTSAVRKVRPFAAAMIVKNIDLTGNKLRYLINFTEKFCDTYGRRRKKIAMGLHNLDVIKPPLIYDASHDGSFKPLGSEKQMSFEEIIEKHQKGLEYSNAIAGNGKKQPYPFLRDTENILSLIPIINSELTRVRESTKNLLVDLTGTSKSGVREAINLFACTFIDMGADVYPCSIVFQNTREATPQLIYNEIRIKRSKVERSLGLFLDDNKIITMANRMGYVAAKYGTYTLVYVPPYRLDVLNEQDVIEDIAIAYGYDKITPLPILGFSSGVPEESREYLNRVSRLMLGFGYFESLNMYLTNERLNFENMLQKYDPKNVIKVAYAKTEAITMLRTSLTPGLLQNLSVSMHQRMPQRLFEVGSVFAIDKNKIIESNNLAFVNEHSKSDFSEIKAVVKDLLQLIDVRKYSLKECKNSSFIDGRCAAIMVGNEMLGYFGELSPGVLENFKLEEPVAAAEIMIDKVRVLPGV